MNSSEYNKQYYQKNKEKRKRQTSIWAKENRDKKNLSHKKWRLANLEKDAAARAEKRARKLKATPLWVDEDEKFLISEVYALAKLRTKATGVQWEVDHIVPLQGTIVCGLHTLVNLQLLPKSLNCKKHNHWDVETSSSFFTPDQRSFSR